MMKLARVEQRTPFSSVKKKGRISSGYKRYQAQTPVAIQLAASQRPSSEGFQNILDSHSMGGRGVLLSKESVKVKGHSEFVIDPNRDFI